jgi:hypothetical protein
LVSVPLSSNSKECNTTFSLMQVFIDVN